MNHDRDPVSQPDGVAEKKSSWFRQSFRPFRIATIRGLALVLPPLLTIMLFVWAWNTIDRAILRPVESLAENTVAMAIENIRDNESVQKEIKEANPPGSNYIDRDDQGIPISPVFVTSDGTRMVQVNNQWIPQKVFTDVENNRGDAKLTTGHSYYRRYVQIRYLKRHLIIPAVLAVLLAVMYLAGKLLAAGIGRIFWRSFESVISRVPILRNVYSSVKQVTDFAFSESDIQFTRVVAVEYPRKGLWSIGFVTGESLLQIRQAAGEPMLSVLMPTSPMPATGFVISVPKSETIELNLSIDQAIQFCVSCGVVVPENQSSQSAITGEVRRRPGQASPTDKEISAISEVIRDATSPAEPHEKS